MVAWSNDLSSLFYCFSASYADTRIYPSVTWIAENAAKGTTIGGGLSLSSEYDYRSVGAHFLVVKKTANRNGEFSVNLHAYFDQLKYILPIELRPIQGGGRDDDDYALKARNSDSASLSYSQIINQRLQVVLIADVVYQQGYLGLPVHRIYFSNNKEVLRICLVQD